MNTTMNTWNFLDHDTAEGGGEDDRILQEFQSIGNIVMKLDFDQGTISMVSWDHTAMTNFTAFYEAFI